MNGINLRRFEFDYDVTWNAFFLDERLNVYGRYGGRDEGDPERRLSKESLLHTMRAVLAAHAEAKAKPDRAAELLQPIPMETFTPEDLPLLKQNHQGCVHCHQAKEYQLLQWSHDGVFDRRKLFGWPLPENVGIEIDRKHGHRVAKPAAGSAVEKAGVRAGDVIVRANGVPVRSEYDLRWVLHRADDGKPIALDIERPVAETPESPQRVKLEVKPEGDWRETELGWRKSMRSVPLEFGFRGYALTKSQRKEAGVDEARLAIRIVSVRSRGLAANVKMQKGDLITALGERTDDRTAEQVLSDLLRQFDPGDRVEFTVLRDGKPVKLSGAFPPWRTDETSVP